MAIGLCWPIVSTDKSITLANDPFAQSLLGEHVRILLIGTAGCSALASAVHVAVDPVDRMLVVGNLLVLASVVTLCFAGVLRGTLIACFAVAVAYMTLQSDSRDRWWSPLIFFSPGALLVSLFLLAVRDFAMAFPGIKQRVSFRVFGTTIGILLILTYMIAVPSIDAILEPFRQRPSNYTVEELSVFEQLRIRTAKFAVFAIFTYAGACVASFVNVVASSAPRGGAIALRTSACPKCGAAIRRIDNLPIFSYLNLGGRCRDCAAVIPIRYFIVEVVGAIIFGSLFLFELVTGAANVPGFPHYHYTGIVWIILYTKWAVISIYFYHAALFSGLMMLALMDIDRLRCPKWLAGTMLAVFAGLSIGFPTLQPVTFSPQTTAELISIVPPWAIPAVNCLVGGSTGWLIASLVKRIQDHRSLRHFVGHQFTLAGALIGIALGWQAAVTIFAFAAIATVVLFATTVGNKRLLRNAATAVLSTVALIHHPAWKWLVDLW